MTWGDRIFIAVLFGAFLFIDLKCHKGTDVEVNPGDTLSSVTTIKKDSTIYSHHTDSHTINKVDSIYVMVPQQIDSAMMRKIVAEYFAYNVFRNVIEDSLLKATITDTVSRNAVIGRQFDYMIKRPQTITTTTIIAAPQRRIYLEGIAGVNVDRVTQLTLKADYFTKKSQLLTGGWDFKNHSVIVGAGIKIK